MNVNLPLKGKMPKSKDKSQNEKSTCHNFYLFWLVKFAIMGCNWHKKPQ